jgi:hypothetical protein|eukprot:jgi/Chrpa1/5934/Chrysochromulina_OHIO_Genome00018826-RA
MGGGEVSGKGGGGAGDSSEGRGGGCGEDERCSFRRSLEVAGGEVAGRATKGITSSLTTCTPFQSDDELTLPMSSARRSILAVMVIPQ